MKLRISSADIETVTDDDRDVNVVSFTAGGAYVTIQVCQYEEGDPLLDSPYIEHNGQESGQYGGIVSIELHPKSIIVNFLGDQLFESKYEIIEIDLLSKINRETVDFLVNKMFLSDYIRYSDDFDASFVVKRTATRDVL